MFTGIVEETGKVQHVLHGASGQIVIRADTVLKGTQSGDSIAVNGVCLTAAALDSCSFTADVMPETLRRSNLGRLRTGDPVHLERAMPADGRFGGHLVSGHIDGTGVIRHVAREQNAIWIQIEASTGILALIIEKGSIAVDGISLTVAGVDKHSFRVSIIPHTADQTTLGIKKPGDIVNLETDLIGKYIWKFLHGTSGGNTPLSLDFLQAHGF